MKMEEMLGFLETQGFDAKKEYDRNMHLYVFTITKDGVTVTDNFEYPVTRNFSLKDKAQRDFLCNLMTVWENRKFYSRFKDKKGEVSMAKHEWTDPETGKKYGYSWGYDIKEKGESKMKDNDNLMYALAQTTAGHLEIMGKKYPVMVKEITSTNGHDRYAAPETLLTCEVMGSSAAYVAYDIAMTNSLVNRINPHDHIPKIKDVIFNPPATIVFWADNTKTVVKCQEGDDFDAEKGLTMAITKKLFGNKGNYCEEIKKWVKKYKPEPVEIRMNGFSLAELDKMIREALGLPTEKKEEPIVAETPETADPEKRWKIWWKRHNPYDGEFLGSGVHCTDYACKSSATRAAHRMFNARSDVQWEVSQDNPWEEK